MGHKLDPPPLRNDDLTERIHTISVKYDKYMHAVYSTVRIMRRHKNAE
jgi:hypothetical protein